MYGRLYLVHDVDLHGIVRWCMLQHMAQGWPRCSACTIRSIGKGGHTMFGNNVRRRCLSNITSVGEKDPTGLAIGDWYGVHVHYEGALGVVECLQENGEGVQGRVQGRVQGGVLGAEGGA